MSIDAEAASDRKPLAGRNICRICSATANYDIFAPIPAFLHASPNDYLYWKKDISTLLEDTTGLSVTPNDGLPSKMCALCISYLKHAATFRQQAIDNILSLKTAQAVLDGREDAKRRMYDRHLNGRFKIEYEPDTKDRHNNAIVLDDDDDVAAIVYTEKDLIMKKNRKTETNNLINNVFNANSTPKTNYYMNKFAVLNQSAQGPNGSFSDDDGNKSNLKVYLNLLFDKKAGNQSRSATKSKRNAMKAMHARSGAADLLGDEFQTASSDDTEGGGVGNKDYFSYSEKNFIEDDVMDLDFIRDANIIINIPEHVKERKCPACFRRFMFEDSYKDHMNSCLEFKFISLIENLNRLVGFRRTKSISPHEFIRRTIFSLRATCQYLSTSCGEEMSMPDLLTGGEVQNPSLQSESTGKDMTGSETDDKVTSNAEDGPKRKRSTDFDPLINLLREKADPSLIRYVSDESGRLSRNTGTTSTCQSPTINTTMSKSSPHTNSDHSSSTSNTEQNITIRSNPAGRKSLLDSFNLVSNERTSTPTQPVTVSPFSGPFGSFKMTFSARCNACDTIFESIASLENHNLQFHNNFQKQEDHKRIIAMFESDDDTVDGGGVVDVLSTKEHVSKKSIKCDTCDKFFATITHLDQHKIKCSPKKKKPSPPYKRFT